MVTVLCTFFILQGTQWVLYREVGVLYNPNNSVIYKDEQIQGKGDWIVRFDALPGTQTIRVNSNSCLITKKGI